MPTMKVTPDAARRARDVSRPHAEHLAWAEEAEASVTAPTDVVIETDVVVKSGAAAEAGNWSAGAERLAMAAAPAAEVDIPDSESSSSEDRPADAGRTDGTRVDGTRRRRVRGLRSSSRRGRPSR